MDDSDNEGHFIMTIGVDSFRDLLKGNIDIIEYLNSGPGSVNGGSTENILDDESKTNLLNMMEVNSILMNGVQHQQPLLHHQQLHQQNQPHLPPPPPRIHHHPMSAPVSHVNTVIGRHANAGSVYVAQHSGHHRNSQDRPPSYDQHVVRLPESPPETDSAAGSAGSPSGSDASPYSPEFQQQYLHHQRHMPAQLHQHHNGPGGHMQGSVIHPPVGSAQTQQNGGSGDGVTSSESSSGQSQQCRQPSDVILNVHGLDHLTQSVVTDFLPMQHSAIMPNHMNGQWTPSNGADYFSLTSAATGQNSANGGHNEMTNGSRPLISAQQQNSPSVTTPATPTSSYTPYVLPALHATPYASETNLHRKRARTENGTSIVKPEPNSPPGHASEESLYYDDSFGGHQQTIRFSEFQKDQWFPLCNSNGREMQPLGFAVVADKGFNYSHFDTAFVNQKKNHFQVSVHIEVRDTLPPKFIRIPDSNTLKAISEFQLDFYGVKAELHSSYVPIKQSQTDRKPVCYEPVKLDLPPNRVTKVTVARLHFSETTMNNQRKNGRPNPDQKYFYLVASLNAIVPGNEKYMIAAYSSERVIVRASNPGQFDNGDSEVHWQKGQSPGSIFHPGPVGVGTDKPTTALSVTGDITCTGNWYHPSDARLKQNIQELNCAEALSKLSQIRVVQYEIRPEIAEKWGLSQEDRQRVGVIAQELEEVIPEAVRIPENGEYLTVDDNRIFYESAAAVKELCRLTGNLEYKIEEVEKISKKLSKLSQLRRLGSLRSTDSVNTCNSSKPADSVCGSYFSCSRSSVATTTPPAARRHKSAMKGEKTVDEDENVKFGGSNGRPKHKHHHHHHHCVCRRLSAGDRGPCSNRVIQTTIILLVVVMAFCLLSMATLYILDWHKRNMAAPVLAAVSGSGHQQMGRDGSSLPSGGGKSGGIGLMQIGSTGRPRQLVPYSPKMINPAPYKPPTPLYPPCLSLPCVEFCCPKSYTYYNVADDNGDSSNVHGLVDNENQNVAIIITSGQEQDTRTWNIPPVGTSFRDRFLNVINTKLNHVYQQPRTSAKDTLNNVVHDTVSLRIEKRRAKLDYISPAVVDSSSWHVYDAPTTVKILTLNETIDGRYCLGDSCADAKRGNFTYYLPVSKYMPHIPLEIHFDIDDKQVVQYCTKSAGEFCYGVEEAVNDNSNNEHAMAHRQKMEFGSDVHPRQEGIWELPVGMFQTSAYRFRVGSTTTLCSLPNDEAGVTYVEYNIHFFRHCL